LVIVQNRYGTPPNQAPVTVSVHWMLLEFMEERFIVVGNGAEETY